MYRLSAKVGTRAAHCCPLIKPLQKRAASCYNRRRLARERQERQAVKERNLGRSGRRVSLVGLGCDWALTAEDMAAIDGITGSG
jgi:hypothetical protein